MYSRELTEEQRNLEAGWWQEVRDLSASWVSFKHPTHGDTETKIEVGEAEPVPGPDGQWVLHPSGRVWVRWVRKKA